MCKIKLSRLNERIYIMQKLLSFILLFCLFPWIPEQVSANSSFMNDENVLTKASQQLLLAAKRREPADSLIQYFTTIQSTELAAELNTDTKKKTFWLNIYNAFTQLFLAKNPEQYKKRSQFFGAKKINIAGELLSLDIIEHGLLRRSTTKWSMGYIKKLFPGKFERTHRVDTVDYRIHFALNCGAKSCPPIAFYRPDQLDKQLDLATKVYLKGEATYIAERNHVELPSIMGWFRGDFGGKKKMKELLRSIAVIPADVNPSISFKKYNWDLYLDNYKTD